MLDVLIEKTIRKKKVKTKLQFNSEEDFKIYLKTLEKALGIKYKIISTNYSLNL